MHKSLWNDSSSFHPVHPLIRAFGTRILHHAKGRCQINTTCDFSETSTREMKTSKIPTVFIQIVAIYVLLLPNQASAQLASGGLKTRVNGSTYGTCTSGICAISGGSRSGPNLLQLLNVFDTRNGISKVKIDTQGLKNIVVGVTSRMGTFLNKPLALSSPANLFWLRPQLYF